MRARFYSGLATSTHPRSHHGHSQTRPAQRAARDPRRDHGAPCRTHERRRLRVQPGRRAARHAATRQGRQREAFAARGQGSAGRARRARAGDGQRRLRRRRTVAPRRARCPRRATTEHGAAATAAIRGRPRRLAALDRPTLPRQGHAAQEHCCGRHHAETAGLQCGDRHLRGRPLAAHHHQAARDRDRPLARHRGRTVAADRPACAAAPTGALRRCVPHRSDRGGQPEPAAAAAWAARSNARADHRPGHDPRLQPAARSADREAALTRAAD